MSKKKWNILVAAGIGLGLLGMALLLVLVFGFFAFIAGHEETTGAASLLPIYTMDQSVSSHAGYRRNTMASGSDVFVNDYEEDCLQLANPEPSTVVGHLGSMGVIKICSIPGQPVRSFDKLRMTQGEKAPSQGTATATSEGRQISATVIDRRYIKRYGGYLGADGRHTCYRAPVESLRMSRIDLVLSARSSSRAFPDSERLAR